MSTVEDVERAIESMTPEDQARIHQWLNDRFEDDWDQQIEQDIRKGKLDELASAAIEAHRQGRTKRFPNE